LLSVLLSFWGPRGTRLAAAASLTEPISGLALTRPGLAEADAVAELVSRLNAEREVRGLWPLEVVDALNASASIRAAELQGDLPLSHERPLGDLLALLAEEGVACTLAGETLARVAAPNPSAAIALAHDLLMGSDAHRDLLLSPAFAYLGVAFGRSGGRWLVVHVLTN
jgi:uncharacterized protein YkwD